MKNISALRLNERQTLILFISTGFLLALSLFAAVFFLREDSAQGFRSVELGLSELSPAGEAGGYAIPASGASVQSCTFDLTPNPVPVGAVTAVEGRWSAVFQNDHAFNSTNQPNFLAFLRANAANDNTDPDTDDNGNERPPEVPVRTLRIWRCNTGTNCVVGQSTGWTQIVDQNINFGVATGTIPVSIAGMQQGNYLYHARVYYSNCAGGQVQCNPAPSEVACSDILELEPIEPPPQPGSVGLGVSKKNVENWRSSVTITPTEEVKLRWYSIGATSCTALSPTHNFNANATSGQDLFVDEPPVSTTYQYWVSCSRADGSTVGTASVFVNTIGSSTPTSSPPIIDVTDPYVPRGEPTTIIWNTNGNNPASCTLSGPGLNYNPVPSGTGSRNVTIYSESIYTIECPGGEDSVNIHVLPIIQET